MIKSSIKWRLLTLSQEYYVILKKRNDIIN